MRIRVPYKVLHSGSISLDDLAFIGVLKSLHTNSTIYSYSSKVLSFKLLAIGLKYSPASVKLKIQRLLKKRLVKYTKNGDLKIIPLKSGFKGRVRYFSIEFNGIQDLKDKLIVELLKIKSRQADLSRFAAKYTKNFAFVQEKSSRKLLRNGLSYSASNKLEISYAGLALMLNCSKTSAYRTIKQLLEKSLIAKTVRRTVIGKGDSRSLKCLSLQGIQGTFIKNGVIYKQEINRYTFCL